MPRSALNRYEIHRGESLGFELYLDQTSPSSWTCTIDVKANPDGSSLITPRTISHVANGLFSGFLKDTETDLTPGIYFLVAKFTYTDKEIQQVLRFRIKKAWV